MSLPLPEQIPALVEIDLDLLETLVALVVGTRAGAFVLAAVVLACAVVRAVLPSPGPVALTVRAKALDVAVLVLLGAGLAVLAQLLP